MKISDMNPDDISVGMRIGSLNQRGPGTIVLVDHCDRYPYLWILWDYRFAENPKEPYISGGFWENQCEVSVCEDQTVPSEIMEFIKNYRKCKCVKCQIPIV